MKLNEKSGRRSKTKPRRRSPLLCRSPQTIIVWCQEFTARFRPLSTEEEMMWDEAAKGVRFGVLCEMVSTFAGKDDAELRAASYPKG